MSRFIRFVVHQRIEGMPRRAGPFSAAYHLLENVELLPNEYRRLEELLAWFTAELTVPPCDTIPPAAIFWYREVGPYSRRMWELAQDLREYGFTTELITARFIGRIVYKDTFQYAAIPTGRRNR
jgi:hypothetical protein